MPASLYTPAASPEVLRWEIERARALGHGERYEAFFKDRYALPATLFEKERVYLEIGAGSGWFITELARRNPAVHCIGIERCRNRGSRLVRKATRSGLPNLSGVRGNAIPTLLHGVPASSIDRLYILYPCPWPKNAHRKHRWYLHPVMPHLLRILKPGGRIVWASDQRFYIDEAKFVCEGIYGMTVNAYGELGVNPFNDLEHFPEGRTKFERTFRAQGLPCHELVVTKS
jgi:tRNA (guanine-N7-)-methyltransferase